MADVQTGTKQDVMHVKLYSPFQVYFNDNAFSISGNNETGAFDILPDHHNFMTLLTEGILLIKAPSGELKVKISRGVMHVRNNAVTVFLDV